MCDKIFSEKYKIFRPHCMISWTKTLRVNNYLRETCSWNILPQLSCVATLLFSANCLQIVIMWPNIPCEASSRHQSPLILRLWSETRCSEDDWWWHWIRWWSELSSLSHSLLLITGHYWRLVLVTSIVYSYQTIMIIMTIITLTLDTDCSATSEITLHTTSARVCARQTVVCVHSSD